MLLGLSVEMGWCCWTTLSLKGTLSDSLRMKGQSGLSRRCLDITCSAYVHSSRTQSQNTHLTVHSDPV